MLDNILQNHHRHFTPGTFSGNVQELSDIILSESNNNFKMKNVSLLCLLPFSFFSHRGGGGGGARFPPGSRRYAHAHYNTKVCGIIIRVCRTGVLPL